jgi:nucleoside 2-deoxyribosyltransferase
MKTGFLICPVRGHSADETKATVENLEKQGWSIYWPPRDTNQDDPTGLNICKQNRQAVESADRVFVTWDGKSQGCLFDLGMAFAARKPVTIVSLPPYTDGKSFQNMVRKWANTDGVE